MSSLFTYMRSQNYSVTAGDNETINIATFTIDGVAPGQTTGSHPGIIAARPTDSNERGLMIAIDNVDGSADAFLATPAEIADYDGNDDAIISWGAFRVPGGQKDVFGPFDWGRFNVVLRQIIGAQCRVSISYNGAGTTL